MPPTVTLAPWELPPACDAPLTAPTDFVFRAPWQYGYRKNARETEIWVRAVRYEQRTLYFFCDGKHPQNGNWILSEGNEHFTFSSSEVNPRSLAEWFRRNTFLWSENAFRQVYFEGAPYGHVGTHRIVINASGTCSLHRGSSMFHPDSGGSVRFNPPFARKPPEKAATLKNQLLATLQDDFSELHFAFNWLYLTPHQKRELLLRFERGNLTQLEMLLRAVLHSQPDLWNHCSTLSWRTEIGHNHICEADQMRLVIPQPSTLAITRSRVPHWVPGSKTVATSPRLDRWKQTFWNHFQPSLNEELLHFAQCARSSNFTFSTIEVEATQPSAHEHLEACLLLRDWWQQNFPSQSFEDQNAEEPTSNLT